MNIPNHPKTEKLQLTKVLHALSDPLRLELVKRLAEAKEKTCSTCADIQVAKSTLSHHFKVLRESGIAQVRIEGKHRYYSLRTDDLQQAFPGLLEAILNVEQDRW
ncbi:ArsR/SmtB family transcription factor [Bacillus atrophaeus]|uniref:Transcriptional regulator (ArsR family) protein n=1 Tax=Bacillus atrophaeus (strain 1942) TaxID=720555 RepID=A0ABN3ZGZ8_BACA1|nr:metalloregulator ArsR/SmtB family transcription factor [Bacillus atrophaeus]AMR64112.1 transcriptional regulator [Bacillus subtilis subsp. globigii]ADP35045.1 putative transcriptional regulator (ArsR family) protein [Bacillus atrophaeus 1942]AIK46424.1 bacterial regulatory, arsR family protein [Bacillus atrophaeus subsp. globigii]ARW05476.1 putative HTH-type transcriptional regulator YczG [Bacillus atrophaeus]EIM09669.1 putative ArsR family transcriptional regulator [Bacillus atrophaeus C89